MVASDELLPWNWKRTREQKSRRVAAEITQIFRRQSPSPRLSPDAYAAPLPFTLGFFI